MLLIFIYLLQFFDIYTHIFIINFSFYLEI